MDCTESSKLDSSLKRHTALIKRIKQSVATDNHDQILKDIDSLSLEKYVDEIGGATLEGIARCKSEKDVWSAVEVRHKGERHPGVADFLRQIISALHRRFPSLYTPTLVAALSSALTGPGKVAAGIPPEQREKEDAARLTRQRPVFRVCSELALVGIITDAAGRSGGEWIMKALKELVGPL